MKLIRYKVLDEYNHGSPEEPRMVQVVSEVEVFSSEDSFEANYEMAQKKSYNGDIAVEDIPESPEEQIASLKVQLESTDYKIIKCSEAQLVGDDLPYDIVDLHAERQELRDRINELEEKTTGEMYKV